MTQVSHQVTTTFSAVDNISRTTANIDKNVGSLTKSFTRLSGAFQNAFQFYVRFRIFGLINQGISAIENAIPGLISRGQEWARTVDDISDATGLAAARSSTLASIATVMTGSADGLSRALGALANTTSNHADVLKRYGIETRNANGQMLDSWTVLRNVRRALSDLGNGFLTTAAARELFSRGGQPLIDMLTLTDQQFRMLEQDARRSGVVMTDAGLRAAETWQRTQQRFEQSITGIANVVTTTVQPILTRLVDGITNYIRQNMTQIVGFVSRVIGFVTGMIAGFLGIDLKVESFFESFEKAGDRKDRLEQQLSEGAKRRGEQTRGEDAYTKAIQGQIDAIDRQLAAMSRADRARDAREEQRRLLAEIAEARKELSDLRSKSIFAAGMSQREAELARQQQAADIVDAEKRITDARRRMQEQGRRVAMEDRRFELEQRRASLQEQMAAHTKAMAERQARDREALGQLFDPQQTGIGDLPGNIQRAMREGARELQDALTKGTPIGEGLRTALDGLILKLQEIWETIATNLPAWVDSLTTIGTHLGNAADLLSRIVDEISRANPFGPGKIDLGIDPGTIAAAGIGAWATKGLWWKKLLGPALGRAAPGLLGAGAGAAGAVGRGLGVVSRVVAPVAAVLAWKDVFDTINSNSQMFEALKSGNLQKLDTFLKSASAPQLQAAIDSLTNLPGSLDGIGGTLYGLSSGLAGLDVLLGNTKEHNEQIIAKLEAEMTRRRAADAATKATMTTLTSHTSSGGRGLASWMESVANYTQRIAYPRAGVPWGTANITINLGNDTLLAILSNIPLAAGNSSIRTRRDI